MAVGCPELLALTVVRSGQHGAEHSGSLGTLVVASGSFEQAVVQSIVVVDRIELVAIQYLQYSV